MFWRVLRGSLHHQRLRVGVAALAVLLGAALVSALVNLSFNMGGHAGRELRAYGANILLLPRVETPMAGGGVASLGMIAEERGIPEDDLAALDEVEGVVGYVPYLYLVAEVGGQPVVVAGVDFGRVRAISPWWQVAGRWPAGPDGGLVGANAAQALGLTPGGRFTVNYGEASRELTLAGIVETGGSEENQIFVALPVAQALSERPKQVGLVQVSALAGGRSLEEITTQIERQLPGIQARTLRQFAQAEEAVLGKIRLLMGLVAGLVLVVAALTVGSTMVTVVLERRAEVGLMKALGAAERQVAAFFLAEGLSVGLLGGLGGYVAGLGVAALIGRQVFQADLLPNPWSLPVTVVVALGVALLASLWPVQRALAVDPAVTLRGE